MRAISHNLRPLNLERLGLTAVIEEMIENLEIDHNNFPRPRVVVESALDSALSVISHNPQHNR